MKRLKYYIAVARWMWTHRDDADCRAKWRRMSREIKGVI
jgi:hypothetical protein